MTSTPVTTGSLADYRFSEDSKGVHSINIRERKARFRRKPPFRFLLFNFTQLRSGDRVVVKCPPEFDLKVTGPAAVVPANQYSSKTASDSSARLHVLYLHKSGNLKIKVRGLPRARISIPVTTPSLPFTSSLEKTQVGASLQGALVPSETGQPYLLGPLQPQLAIPDSEILTPLDRWIMAVDLTVNSGCNYFSACPISPWNNLDVGVPFPMVGQTFLSVGPGLSRRSSRRSRKMDCLTVRGRREITP